MGDGSLVVHVVSSVLLIAGIFVFYHMITALVSTIPRLEKDIEDLTRRLNELEKKSERKGSLPFDKEG